MEEVNVTPDPNDVQSNKVMVHLGLFRNFVPDPSLGCKRVGLCTLSHQPRAYLFLFVFVCGILGVIPKIGWLITTVGYLAGFVFFIIGVINALVGR